MYIIYVTVINEFYIECTPAIKKLHLIKKRIFALIVQNKLIKKNLLRPQLNVALKKLCL